MGNNKNNTKHSEIKVCSRPGTCTSDSVTGRPAVCSTETTDLHRLALQSLGEPAALTYPHYNLPEECRLKSDEKKNYLNARYLATKKIRVGMLVLTIKCVFYTNIKHKNKKISTKLKKMWRLERGDSDISVLKHDAAEH